MGRGSRWAYVSAAVGLAAALCTPASAQTAGGKYVAMGSSFAAGPVVTTSADTPTDRCRRSTDNYPRQLARKRGLNLVDVSCSGATTAHILGAWAPFPAQLDALDANTQLVTVTIGGNDIGYMVLLGAGACRTRAATSEATAACTAFTPPSEDGYRKLEAQLDLIGTEVRRRAPKARLVFVQYFSIVPEALCPAVPLTPDQAAEARALARRLAEVTAKSARKSGADVLDLDKISADHHACAKAPWVNGSLTGPATDGVSWHPNLAGMTGAAVALDGMLKR